LGYDPGKYSLLDINFNAELTPKELKEKGAYKAFMDYYSTWSVKDWQHNSSLQGLANLNEHSLRNKKEEGNKNLFLQENVKVKDPLNNAWEQCIQYRWDNYYNPTVNKKHYDVQDKQGNDLLELNGKGPRNQKKDQNQLTENYLRRHKLPRSAASIFYGVVGPGALVQFYNHQKNEEDKRKLRSYQGLADTVKMIATKGETIVNRLAPLFAGVSGNTTLFFLAKGLGVCAGGYFLYKLIQWGFGRTKPKTVTARRTGWRALFQRLKIYYKLISPEEPPKTFYNEDVEKRMAIILDQINFWKQKHIDEVTNLFLYGPPGTGKTLFVEKIIKTTGLPYIFTSGSRLQQLGQDSVGAINQEIIALCSEAAREKRCIFFIDECDKVAGNALDTLLGEFSKGVSKHVLLILATNNPNQVNKAIQGRTLTCSVGMPNAKTIEKTAKYYLGQEAGKYELTVDKNLDFSTIAQNMLAARQSQRNIEQWASRAAAQTLVDLRIKQIKFLNSGDDNIISIIDKKNPIIAQYLN
ncbi:MAG: ATP-binding protein, partial [Cytophagales bacterium]